MLRSISQRLTYANVTATLALFLALGGISWAATSLPKNSVGATQLRKNAVTGTKIKRSAVTSSKVKNGSLTAADLKKGTLLSGPTGPTGPAGPKGDTGAAGPSEAYTTVKGGGLQNLTNSFAAVVTSPELPAGDYVVAARANVLGSGGAGTQIICSLESDAAQNIPAVAGDNIPLSMTSPVHLATARAVDLHCLKVGPGVPQVAQAVIIATRVGTLTGP